METDAIKQLIFLMLGEWESYRVLEWVVMNRYNIACSLCTDEEG